MSESMSLFYLRYGRRITPEPKLVYSQIASTLADS
jgi:hypothetical protein